MQKGLTFQGNGKTFIVGELLGEGQFGKVYRTRSDSYSEDLAVKIIRKSKFSRNSKLKQLLQRQMEVLCKFSHQNVIQFHELIADKQDIYLIYQYCQGGTLQDKIVLTQNQLEPMLKQMLDALSHAEKNGIIHRDIKPANILFKEGNIKIADWGFSRLLDFGQTTCSFIGSPAYMAPEVLKGEQYTIKADVWSLGVVLYETLTGMCPWRSSSVTSLITQIFKKPLMFPKDLHLSSKLKKTIRQMLNVSPLLRPNFSQIKQSLNYSPLKKSSKLQKTCSSTHVEKQIQQQQKISSCVFFLQLIQWSRKKVEDNTTLLTFVKLVEKNLLRLKPEESQGQIFHVWEKELKVVKEIEKKMKTKLAALSSRSRNGSFLKAQIDKTLDQCLNPEGEWQSLAKNTIKMVIELLETGYRQVKQSQQRKNEMLIQINLLLDLVIFQDVTDDYLKASFQSYMAELQKYSSKTLLKLINYKLVVINKKYYQL